MIVLTIIVPIYNVELYLKECLDSVVRQIQNDNVELILINDGSTDSSGRIAKVYAEKYSFVYYIEKRNGGLSSARNAGLERASGEYILYLDSDDCFSKDTINTVLNALKNNDYPDLLIFSGIKFGENDTVAGRYEEQCGPNIDLPKMRGIELYKKLKSSKNYFTGVYYQVIKRKVLLNHHITFINGILHEDHLYTFETLTVAESAIAISNRLYCYRIRPNSIMTSNTNSVKRFIAYSITYKGMREWQIKYQLDDKCINKHIDEVGMAALKNMIVLSDSEYQEKLKVIEEFKGFIIDDKNSTMRLKLIALAEGGIHKVFIRLNKYKRTG